jgi:sialate O-acetylesterase
MKRHFVIAALFAAFVCLPARADVKPHALISDGMVLQQGVACKFWGTADPGEPVTIILDIGNSGTAVSVAADKDGKWLVSLPKQTAGGPYTLTITGLKNKISLKDVYFGEVWVASGQSNMEWTLNKSADADKHKVNSKNPKIRLFTVPKKTADTPQDDVNGKWVECGPDTGGSFSGVAYFFGRDLQAARNVPIGLIHSSWGGTVCEAWAPLKSLAAVESLKKEIVDPYQAKQAKALAAYPDLLKKYQADAEQAKKDGKTAPRAPTNPATDPNRPAVLYNAMIHPLEKYAVKGAIWYQGESNAGRAEQYRTLFSTMIKSWRDVWHNEQLGFYFVQLAPYEKAGGDWPRLREAQLLALKLPYTGMAVITDVGEENDIHPKRKEPVGTRLALAARAVTYGEKIESLGPLYENMQVDGDKAVLSFTHIGKGLECKGEKLSGFTVAGEDKMFYPATAEIKGDKIVVLSDKVTKPVAVRFGWANYPVVNLWNKDGLPASPFRTDDWAPVAAKPK